MYLEGGEGVISYEPLWNTMKKNRVSQYKLLQSGINNRTLNALKNNRNITVMTLERLCRILNCTPNDIVKFDE